MTAAMPRRDAVRLGLRVPPADNAAAVADTIVRAEAYGWDTVWLGDSQLLWRDPFTTLAVAALRTQRIRLGIAVTNLRTRHISVLASTIRTVAELAPGRLVVAVGAGHSSVRSIGMGPSPTRELATNLHRLRTLLAGDTVDFGARPPVPLGHPPAVEVPLYVAATGPRNLRLAGQLGDGALILAGTTPEALRTAADTVAQGAADAGRDPASVPLVVAATCLLSDRPEHDARRLKPHALTIAADGGRKRLADAGVVITGPGPAGWPRPQPDLLHAADPQAAIAACDAHITDDAAAVFAKKFALVGTPQTVRERITALYNTGASEVFLQHPGSYDPPEDLLPHRGALTRATHLRPSMHPDTET